MIRCLWHKIVLILSRRHWGAGPVAKVALCFVEGWAGAQPRQSPYPTMKGLPLQPIGKGLGGVFQRCVEPTLEKRYVRSKNTDTLKINENRWVEYDINAESLRTKKSKRFPIYAYMGSPLHHCHFLNHHSGQVGSAAAAGQDGAQGQGWGGFWGCEGRNIHIFSSWRMHWFDRESKSPNPQNRNVNNPIIFHIHIQCHKFSVFKILISNMKRRCFLELDGICSNRNWQNLTLESSLDRRRRIRPWTSCGHSNAVGRWWARFGRQSDHQQGAVQSMTQRFHHLDNWYMLIVW